jgi:hypothetical protein
MNEPNPHAEEIRRQAYAHAHELLEEYRVHPVHPTYDGLLNLLVLAWLAGYGTMADWTKAELAASAARLTAALAELPR